MTNEEIQILQGLNPAQEAAVRDFQAPSLIVAGAGSGKTRVLTCRIAWMISQGVAPYSIMALTFTNKAAKEMRERITTLVGEAKSRYIWMGTFHSVFLRILYNEVDKIGFQPNFTIYDTAQSESLIKSLIKEMQLSDEVYKPREVHSRISLAKNNLVTYQSYESSAQLMEEDKKRRMPQFYQLYRNYCVRCKQNNAMDFDDLLLQTNILFRDHPEVLAKYRERFPYILVDEYQDTNYAQYLIVRSLAGSPNANICVVGDDAQSIYSFRGAKIENIFRFQRDFPSARIYKLEQNYRSTQTIVDAANSIIEHNQHRIKKRVFSENSQGERIRVFRAYTEGEEAQMVANGIRAAHIADGGNDWSNIAILYRTNAQSRALEEALRKRDIPYRIYGGHSFYDRKEVKDLMAYFKTISNPRDDESLLRIINYPARGIGDVTIGKIRSLAQSKGLSMWEAMMGATPEEQAIMGRKVLDFLNLISSLSLSRNDKTLYEFGLEVATRSGIISAYKLNPTPENESALQNVEELLNSMQNFRHEMIEVGGEEEVTEPTLEVWLHNISLLTDMDEKDIDKRNWVTLLTVHSSKGLEFDHVFITGLEENLFPSVISLASPDQIEEERRLFYVAVTRAKRDVTITFAASRFKWGSMEFSRPSRFLKEIDPRYLDLRYEDDEEEQEEESRNRGRGQIEDLRRRFDQRQGRTIVERREFRSQTTPITPNRPTQQPTPQRPDTSRMRSIGVRSEGESGGTVSSCGNYAVGQRVKHSRFGTGVIQEIEVLQKDAKITVVFDNPLHGKKNLLSNYAKLEVI
ncbi:MAG: UvrD-helicase domain-containing protein [Tidjanibacter sp.]|nr:UvrD-helicase domain-containing protein [Tidjanibacter sp.]